MRAAGEGRTRIFRALVTANPLRAALGAGAILAGLMASASADPVATHPRLWVTAADLPRLRSWAVNSNPMYAQGLSQAAAQAKTNADAHWNWTTGKPDSGWQDDGSTGWVGDCTEAYAQMFAFMALVDPAAANRAQWAKRARIMLMWEINQAALGFASGPNPPPFRDPAFPSFNRANYWGEAFPLVVDWIYSYLSAADKAQIRKVFMLWDNHLLTVSTAGEEHPQPVGVQNSIKLLGMDPAQNAYTQQQAQLQLRWAANNYDLGHMRMMALTALSFDAADDPLVNNSKPAMALGNSLRSYFADVTGAWLYQSYALFEDAATVRHAYKLGSKANVSLGLASAGPPVEGSLYGESLGFLGETLLAMHTSGNDSTATWGPQAGFFASSYWDRAIDGFIHSIAPASYVPAKSTGETYLGNVWPVAEYGDILRAYAEPDSSLTLSATVGILDQQTGGNPTRLQKSRWITKNVPVGGPSAFYSRAANVWGNSDATVSILYYLLYSPASQNPADPRPDMPTKYVGLSTGTIYARTNWTTNSSWFTFRCGWETINHQSGDCGQFQFMRKGQWITKEWGGYAIDGLGYTSLYQNNMGIQNVTPQNLNDLYAQTSKYGSQWNNGGNDGDPSVQISVNDNWAYALADATPLYNHPDFYSAAESAMAVTQASRSIVWLAPDAIVVYDRAATNKPNLFKHFNLVLLNPPTITGKTATVVSNGQKLTVQSLLPTDAVIHEQHFWKTDSNTGKPDYSTEMDSVADLEASRDRLYIAGATAPENTRFLTVIQGSDASVTAPTATLIHSASGTAFDGAYVGNTAVLFPVTVSKTAASFTYAVPAAVTRHLITGLVPGAKYALQITAVEPGAPVTVTVSPNAGGTAADVGGVVGFGFPDSKTATLGGSVAGFKMTPVPQ